LGTWGRKAPVEVAEVAVGVACGVDAEEFAFGTEMGAGVCLSPLVEAWYTDPSSLGIKVNAEQKPSEDVISSVRPSLDHVRSVKVA